MKRTFIALPIPPADERLLAFLQYIRRQLKDATISWVDPSIMHITLFFLGDTGSEKIPLIMEGLTKLAKNQRSFFYACSGAGYFGSTRDPRVIWAGIDHPSELLSLQEEVSKCIQQLGWKEEERVWHPHLTLGRIKKISPETDLRKVLAPYKEQELQIIEAREIIFFESLLSPAGPIYRPLARIPLTG